MKYPNTAEVRGYQVMRGELDGDARDLGDSDLSSRTSLDFYDDGPSTDRLNNSFQGQAKPSQRSQKDSLNSSQESPHHSYKTSINSQDLRLPLRAASQQETFRSPRSKLGEAPEAWLVFSNEGRGPHDGGFSTDRAVPVNLANSIGSRLQVHSTCATCTKSHTLNYALFRLVLPT